MLIQIILANTRLSFISLRDFAQYFSSTLRSIFDPDTIARASSGMKSIFYKLPIVTVISTISLRDVTYRGNPISVVTVTVTVNTCRS